MYDLFAQIQGSDNKARKAAEQKLDDLSKRQNPSPRNLPVQVITLSSMPAISPLS